MNKNCEQKIVEEGEEKGYLTTGFWATRIFSEKQSDASRFEAINNDPNFGEDEKELALKNQLIIAAVRDDFLSRVVVAIEKQNAEKENIENIENIEKAISDVTFKELIKVLEKEYEAKIKRTLKKLGINPSV